MKKIFVLAAMFCLCFQAISVRAATPDFSGSWELDVVKSTLPEMMRVESMMLNVTQTEKELKVESATKRAAGGMRGGGASQTLTYSLEGKEITADINGGAISGKENRRAAMTTDGKLNLTVTRVLNSETGSVTIKTNDIWELLDEGNTLKVTRYTETPRGATTAELFFTKRREGIAVRISETPVRIGSDTTTKSISGGVLNGKAISLPKPAYPAAARAERARGTVNVQVTIDEQGNVVSASAISGHELLRSAAVEAAKKSKFSPTMLEGVPVMVTGVIVYNFVP